MMYSDVVHAWIVTDGDWYEFVASETSGQARFWAAQQFCSGDDDALSLNVRRARPCDHLCDQMVTEPYSLDWETCAQLMGWDVEAIKAEYE